MFLLVAASCSHGLQECLPLLYLNLGRRFEMALRLAYLISNEPIGTVFTLEQVQKLLGVVLEMLPRSLQFEVRQYLPDSTQEPVIILMGAGFTMEKRAKMLLRAHRVNKNSGLVIFVGPPNERAKMDELAASLGRGPYRVLCTAPVTAAPVAAVTN
jgi:hypothetical protein